MPFNNVKYVNVTVDIVVKRENRKERTSMKWYEGNEEEGIENRKLSLDRAEKKRTSLNLSHGKEEKQIGDKKIDAGK